MMRVAPIRAQALVAMPPNAKAIDDYNPPETHWRDAALRAQLVRAPGVVLAGRRVMLSSPRPRPAAALAPHAGGGPFLLLPPQRISVTIYGLP